jgi:aerobic carbon-monoxide dehydrogenase medium subunit
MRRNAFFSVGSTPMRARGAEAALVGATFGSNAIVNAQAALAEDLDPPDDEHVPAAMRLHLARVLLGRLLGRLMEAV